MDYMNNPFNYGKINRKLDELNRIIPTGPQTRLWKKRVKKLKRQYLEKMLPRRKLAQKIIFEAFGKKYEAVVQNIFQFIGCDLVDWDKL